MVGSTSEWGCSRHRSLRWYIQFPNTGPSNFVESAKHSHTKKVKAPLLHGSKIVRAEIHNTMQLLDSYAFVTDALLKFPAFFNKKVRKGSFRVRSNTRNFGIIVVLRDRVRFSCRNDCVLLKQCQPVIGQVACAVLEFDESQQNIYRCGCVQLCDKCWCRVRWCLYFLP